MTFGKKMKSARDILRPTICFMSILVFWLLGAVGEELLNLPHHTRIVKELEHMPTLTQFFLGNFHLNAGHFILSLTPLMILMLGVASLPRRQEQSDLYWLLFVGVWLLAIAYILVFILALVIPFHILLIESWETPVTRVVWSINSGIAALLIASWIWMKLKQRKAEQHAGQVSSEAAPSASPDEPSA